MNLLDYIYKKQSILVKEVDSYLGSAFIYKVSHQLFCIFSWESYSYNIHTKIDPERELLRSVELYIGANPL